MAGSPFAEGAKHYDPASYTRVPGEPPDPDPSTFGMRPDGTFQHPERTPDVPRDQFIDWPGQLTYRDTGTYASNVTVVAHHPIVLNPTHTWQCIYDMGGRRYMIHYDTSAYNIYDITDPADLRVLVQHRIDRAAGEHSFGPLVIRYDEGLGTHVMIQGYEAPRYSVVGNKWLKPENVQKLYAVEMLRGFRIFRMTSPTTWDQISETTTDPWHSAHHQPQEGSGVVDLPVWFGGRYMFTASAPDNSFTNTPYRMNPYSNAHIAWDVSDLRDPRRLGTWWVPGQRAGEAETSPYYQGNPRWNDRTSWLGARTGLHVPIPVEDGGRYGYAAQGGLGLFVVDISDPADMRTVGHLAMPPSVVGTEGDGIDATKVATSGYLYWSNGPQNNDCYGPEPTIFQVDVSDPTAPRISNRLPRPSPPPDAPFTDFCQRRGSFGPRRPGYYISPGTPHQGVTAYPFFNAGLQIYDLSDPETPRIGGYFVPPLGLTDDDDIASGSQGVFFEWDRNLIWLATNVGLYCLSTPLLGEPELALSDAQPASKTDR